MTHAITATDAAAIFLKSRVTRCSSYFSVCSLMLDPPGRHKSVPSREAAYPMDWMVRSERLRL
jgi:hypothetical protein